ncbi:OLC1v1008764C1 [Oldenlandia corymbosa var. corymbosa]|uniref:OLC1v1008764C1 n=1 Tax=Oldenlandia corymbosa var. corymbosa TaxID=529605 RepID=A0AAV1DMG2_OLDCO|nr:OLC1v1008764C1 [Oldenlandia corymbosa var. corymbosa]
MATAIRKPLKVDAPTLNMTRPSVARFCVEVYLTKELPKLVNEEENTSNSSHMNMFPSIVLSASRLVTKSRIAVEEGDEWQIAIGGSWKEGIATSAAASSPQGSIAETLVTGHDQACGNPSSMSFDACLNDVAPPPSLPELLRISVVEHKPPPVVTLQTSPQQVVLQLETMQPQKTLEARSDNRFALLSMIDEADCKDVEEEEDAQIENVYVGNIEKTTSVEVENALQRLDSEDPLRIGNSSDDGTVGMNFDFLESDIGNHACWSEGDMENVLINDTDKGLFHEDVKVSRKRGPKSKAEKMEQLKGVILRRSLRRHQRSEPVFDPEIEATTRRTRAARRRQNRLQHDNQEGSSEMANQGGNPENNRNPGGDQQNRPERLLRDFFIPQQEEVQSPLVFLDEQTVEKPGVEEIQFPAPIKEPQQPAPNPPYPEWTRYLPPPTDFRKCNIKGLREPTPPPPPQPPRALQEQALNAITDEWEPRLFPRKKGWDFFLKHIRRKFITERGIGEDGSAFTYIKRHGWGTFSNPPVKPRIQIVQEFYGNFHTAPRDRVFVRGISVNCSTEAIRAIWKLPRISTNYRETLAALHPNQPLEHAILSRLAKEGTSWEMDDQENSLGFPANALQMPYLNLWHRFICCNLMPTSYTAKVTYEMALLLYAIVTDTPFDVASVVRDQLTRCITDPKVKSWYFPVMITMLCKRAGVTFLHTYAESNFQQPLRMHKLQVPHPQDKQHPLPLQLDN